MITRLLVLALLGCASLTQATTFTVTNTADSGAGSLRQAIVDANGASGDDTIVFALTGIITLASPSPTLSGNTTITGPGTNLLTISGNNSVSVFTVNAGTTSMISGLTIANARATGYANGAGILNAGTLTISNCALVNNQTFGGWGGAIFNSGQLTVINSTLSGNQVTGDAGGSSISQLWYEMVLGGGGGAGLGGALFTMSGSVIITNCAFLGNSATGGKGGTGIYSTSGTGRGGGINGGLSGGTAYFNGHSGGFGGGGGGGYLRESSVGKGGTGGFGGGGGGRFGVDAPGGFGGGAGGYPLNYDASFGGAGGGGGAGLGGGIFVDSGTATIVNCSFYANQVAGGLGGAVGALGKGVPGVNGSGIGGGVFTRTGTVDLHNSGVNIVNPSTPLETWTYGGLQRLAPVGTPAVFADGQFTLENVMKRSSVQMSLQTSFAGGTIVYSLNGADPRSSAKLYTGPFTVRNSAVLRAVAYNSTFTASVEMDPVQITIFPTLTVNTAGGGIVNIEPPSGPYFSNSVAQITAQSAAGCTFLQWLGAASGTNPITTVTMTQDKYVEAVFGTAVGTTVVGGGSILADPSMPFYPFGTTIRFTAQPQTGNYFTQWGASASGTNNPLNFAVSSATPNVAVVFSPLTGSKYALTVIENGRGNVLRSPLANTYTNGQTVTLAATPEAGQDFVGWDGDASGTNNPLTVTMNPSKVITANFTKRPNLRVGTLLEGLVEDGFRLTLTGEFGAVYQIDGSTDLSGWTPLRMVTNDWGMVQFIDGAGTNWPQRFYRALALP